VPTCCAERYRHEGCDDLKGAAQSISSAGMQRRVRARVDRRDMSRRQRQSNELRDLCSVGAVGRAIDLAFEHFVHFGRDDEIIEVLAQAIARADPAGRVRQRFAELCASHDSLPSGIA
jgi:hypothetical protein